MFVFFLWIGVGGSITIAILTLTHTPIHSSHLVSLNIINRQPDTVGLE